MPRRRPGPRARRSRRPADTVGASTSPIVSTTHAVSLRKPVRCIIPKFLQLFPDELECWGKTVVSNVFSGGLALNLSFKANSPFNLFGPQVNWAGAFGGNVPAGAYYLISSNAAGGSQAPYNFCNTTHLETQLEVTGFGAGTTGAATCFLIPSANPSFSGMPLAQLKEIRGVSYCYVPPVTMVPITLSNRLSIADLAGVSSKEVDENYNYAQVPGANPTSLAYLHCILSSSDGATNIALAYTLTFRSRMIFRRINNFVTTIPA